MTPLSAPDAAPAAVRSRAQLITALSGLIVFALCAFLVSLDPAHPLTQGVDDAWRRWVGTAPGPETSPLPMFFQHLGQGPGILVLGLLIPVTLLAARRWRTALFFFTGFVLSTLVAQVVKNLVERPRPTADLTNGLYGPLFRVDHGSFPSGHCVTAGCAVVAIAALIPAARRRLWWVLGALIALGMIWQRTFINAHWLSDAIIGITVGMCTTALVWWLFTPLLARDAGKPARRTAPTPAPAAASTPQGAS